METYGQWAGRFTAWCADRGAEVMAVSGVEVRAYLDALALEAKVRIATQHQALNALACFLARCWAGRWRGWRITCGRVALTGCRWC